MIFQKKLLFLVLIFSLLACATVKTEEKIQPPQKPLDLWHGRFLHVSKKYILVLNHFSPESVSVDIFANPSQPDNRPQTYFFGDIKGDRAVFDDFRKEGCEMEIRQTLEGPTFWERCHGFGEDVGLYKRMKDSEL